MMRVGVSHHRITWALIAVLVAGGAFGIFRLIRNPVAELPGPGPAERERDPQGLREQVERPPRPAEGYVGTAACAECHSGIHESFRAHPMGHSLAAVSEASTLEDYSRQTTVDMARSARRDVRIRYKVERKGDAVFHREVGLDGQGEVVYEQSVPIHYAVGSGARGRSYITDRDGLMFMSPITWYSQKGRWDLSPGYELTNWRFERPILDGCITCHAGRVAAIPGQSNRFEADPFIEESISCERCHGPAAEHVALHRRGPAPGEPDPIVNPEDLSPSQRDAVCFQCHLQGKERILRYGRTHYDFRPGDEIADVWTVFVTGSRVSHDQTTEAVSQVEQMLASTCYQSSDGRLGCISCHDPHSIPEPSRRIEFYRSRCLECHNPESTECSLPLAQRREVTAEDSCIECHMPALPANDVPHTSQTDHRILTSPAREATRAAAGEPSRTDQAFLRIFGQESSGLAEADVERARGLLLAARAKSGSNALAQEAIRRLRPWFDAAPDDLEVAENLASMYVIVKDNFSAYGVWKQAVDLNPDSEQALRGLMVLCHDNERLQEGVEYAQRLTALNPWNHNYFARLAHMLGQLGRLEEGIQAAERAIELNPTDVIVHGWLSDAYGLTGNAAEATQHRQMLDKLLSVPSE